MNSSKSETPDTSVLAFNSMYDEIRGKNHIGETNTGKYTNQMAENIWRICFYVVNGSPKKKIISDNLQDLFKNNVSMNLDLGADVSIVVDPPSKSTNYLRYEVGKQSIFQYGHLKFELIGNPKFSMKDDEITIISRLKYLYELLKSKD